MRRKIRQEYGADGQKIARNDGYDEIRREYDENNKPVRYEYYLNGEPVLNVYGVAIMTQSYDEEGRVVEEAYFGTAGETILHPKNKYHRIQRTWWEKGLAASEAWFDEKDEPMTMGDTYVRIEKDYDGNRNVIAERTYGADGQKIARKDGYDEIQREYDENNKPVWYEYYLNGEPVLNVQGVAVMTQAYDENGLVVDEAYFGTDGEAVCHARNKYHRIQRIWWEKGLAASEAWFDEKEKPMTMGDNYVKIQKEYDDRKNVTEIRYYDAEGRLILCNNGYAIVRREYNENNQMTAETWYDTEGNPAKNKDGYTRKVVTYDAEGKATETFE